MKKLKKLNLVSLADKEFSKRELINMKGGYTSGSCCGCGCHHNTVGANFSANFDHGYYDSIGGGAVVCMYQDIGHGDNPNCY